MAKARIASKNAQSASPTPAKPTVDKVPPAAQAKPAPQAKPTANTVTKPAPQAKPQGGQTVTRTGADAADAAEKVGGTQNIPASQKVTPTSSTSGPGRGSIKFQKGALSKLVSGGSGNTAQKPAQPKAQDALNRNPNKPRVGQDALNRNPNRQRVGTPATASRKIDGAGLANTMRAQNSQSGGAVKTAQAPQSGNTSSSSSKTIGVDPSPGRSDTKSLVNNNKSQNVQNAKKVTNQMNQLNKREAEFEIPDYNDIPVKNSKGKTVKKVPGSNSMPTGGSNKSVSANLDSF